MSHDAHDDSDASYAKETIAHASPWSGKVLPLVTDDAPQEKLDEPPKLSIKPLLSGEERTTHTSWHESSLSLAKCCNLQSSLSQRRQLMKFCCQW